jgi:hypothetical protein
VSTLDLQAHGGRDGGDEEMLALLGVALSEDVDAGPTEADLRWLHAALDEHFGPVAEEPRGGAEARRRVRSSVVPFPRRLTAVVTSVAAALVLLALGLAWSGSGAGSGSGSGGQGAPASPASLTRLQYATSALRKDLAHDGSPARIAHDVTQLAQVLTSLPASERTEATSGAPGLLLTTACGQLEHPSAAEGAGGRAAHSHLSPPSACGPESPRPIGTRTPSAGGASGADARGPWGLPSDRGTAGPSDSPRPGSGRGNVGRAGRSGGADHPGSGGATGTAPGQPGSGFGSGGAGGNAPGGGQSVPSDRAGAGGSGSSGPGWSGGADGSSSGSGSGSGSGNAGPAQQGGGQGSDNPANSGGQERHDISAGGSGPGWGAGPGTGSGKGIGIPPAR